METKTSGQSLFGVAKLQVPFPHPHPTRQKMVAPWGNWSGKSLSGFTSLSRKQGQRCRAEHRASRSKLADRTWDLEPLLRSCIQNPELPVSLFPIYHLGRKLEDASLEEKKGLKETFQRLGFPKQGSGWKMN